MATEWNMNTDIYDITSMLNELKKKYIEDEDETTLALGIFGYLTDVEAKKIQSSVIMTGQLGNEMFPTRARLTKDVLTHAIFNSVTDVNAVPAEITINMGIKVSDLEKYISNNKFMFDAESAIYIDDYEFHFDYDIILSRSKVGDSYMYSAHYDMTNENRLSNIVDPYLSQPFQMKIGNDMYVIFQCTVRQYTVETTTDKIVSNSIVSNKTYTFEFENQLADFDVYVTDDGVTKRLVPYLYNEPIDDSAEYYCRYLFISSNTIRIEFDSKSYIPGLNTDIVIKAYTTLGSSGNFKYTNIDSTYEGFDVEINSDTYNYSKITCYVVAVSDSSNGSDTKSKEELQSLIPKAAISRGSITTESDVTNYFNLINSDSNRLVMQKKVDNIIERVWYAYFVLKDELNNIIPTNTVKLKLHTGNRSLYVSDDGRYILPAGSVLKLDNSSGYAEIMDEADVPELFSDDYFNDNYYYYMTVYNLVLCPDPLYAAFYLTISNKDEYFIYNWVNENCELQFVANHCNFQRSLLTDQSTYRFTFSIAQSIIGDYGMYYEEKIQEVDSAGDTLNKTVVTNNMKAILVLYKEEAPYRWKECTLKSIDESTYISSWEIDFQSDNALDDKNNIKILDLNVAGYKDSVNYGYFDSSTKAVLYILGKFSNGEFGRYNLDDIIPGGLDGYTVTNVYSVSDGLNFYENFTDILNTKVSATAGTDIITVSGVPVVGMHYMTDEDHAIYLIDAMYEKKAYIDYCLELLENSMDIDFKFFNTYGPSYLYSIGDSQNTSIGHTDLSMNYRLSLKSGADAYTKSNIISDIKAYIEDLNDTGDWHAPNMISEITNNYETQIYYLEFMNYNNFQLGIQHITGIESDDPNIVPEFLNIRNRYNAEGELEPCIDIEIVS